MPSDCELHHPEVFRVQSSRLLGVKLARIPVLPPLDERLLSWARTSVRSLKLRSSLNCASTMSSQPTALNSVGHT